MTPLAGALVPCKFALQRAALQLSVRVAGRDIAQMLRKQLLQGSSSSPDNGCTSPGPDTVQMESLLKLIYSGGVLSTNSLF